MLQKPQDSIQLCTEGGRNVKENHKTTGIRPMQRNARWFPPEKATEENYSKTSRWISLDFAGISHDDWWTIQKFEEIKIKQDMNKKTNKT